MSCSDRITDAAIFMVCSSGVIGHCHEEAARIMKRLKVESWVSFFDKKERRERRLLISLEKMGIDLVYYYP